MSDNDNKILRLIYSNDRIEEKKAKPSFQSDFAMELSNFCDELDAQIEAILRL